MTGGQGVSRPATLHSAVAGCRSALSAAAWRLLAVGGGAVFAAGCTTLYEGRYDFSEGWRKAEVVRIEPFEKLSAYEVPRCRAGPPSAAGTGATWAVVRYRAGRRSRNAAIPLSPSDAFKVGELVYANVSDCSREIRHRIAAD